MNFDLIHNLRYTFLSIFTKRLFFFLLLTWSLYACQSESSKEGKQSVQQDSVTINSTSSNGNALLHYWDDYNFNDVDAVQDPNRGEQAFVDFIYLFPQFDRSTIQQAIARMLDKASVNQVSFDFFVKQYEKYLYDPNSPMRSDLYYEPVLAYLSNSKMVADTEKAKQQTLLKLVKKNQIGSQAADFAFLTTSGAYSSLSKVDSRYTILFFYEPGCSHCELAISELKYNEVINGLVANKELVFLAVYPFGGAAIWKGYQDQIPKNWMNVFDEKEEVVKAGKYDLKATPTIFLLDQERRVLLKDTDVSSLLSYLQDNRLKM